MLSKLTSSARIVSSSRLTSSRVCMCLSMASISLAIDFLYDIIVRANCGFERCLFWVYWSRSCATLKQHSSSLVTPPAPLLFQCCLIVSFTLSFLRNGPSISSCANTYCCPMRIVRDRQVFVSLGCQFVRQ